MGSSDARRLRSGNPRHVHLDSIPRHSDGDSRLPLIGFTLALPLPPSCHRHPPGRAVASPPVSAGGDFFFPPDSSVCRHRTRHPERSRALFPAGIRLALDWGSRGRWFESSPPDQNSPRPSVSSRAAFFLPIPPASSMYLPSLSAASLEEALVRAR